MAITDGFKSRIGVVALTLTKFIDQNGIWAKRPESAAHLMYTFADGHDGYMTYAEYKTLPQAQRVLINQAPSSPAI